MADWDFSEVIELAGTLAADAEGIEEQSETILTKTGADITRDAKSLAPVDTSNLKNSISMTGSGLQREVSPTAEYGIFQELGTSTQPAQPYLTPALERNQPGMVQAFEQLVGGVAGG